jgi:hypothetical protein
MVRVHWLLSGCSPGASQWQPAQRANLSQTLGNVTLAIELAHEGQRISVFLGGRGPDVQFMLPDSIKCRKR